MYKETLLEKNQEAIIRGVKADTHLYRTKP